MSDTPFKGMESVDKEPSVARRVPPNPGAPKLRPATAERLAALDEKSAQTYDAMEDATALAVKFKEQAAAGEITCELEITDTAVDMLKKNST